MTKQKWYDNEACLKKNKNCVMQTLEFLQTYHISSSCVK